jgi:hypothetical protein
VTASPGRLSVRSFTWSVRTMAGQNSPTRECQQFLCNRVQVMNEHYDYIQIDSADMTRRAGRAAVARRMGQSSRSFNVSAACHFSTCHFPVHNSVPRQRSFVRSEPGETSRQNRNLSESVPMNKHMSSRPVLIQSMPSVGISERTAARGTEMQSVVILTTQVTLRPKSRDLFDRPFLSNGLNATDMQLKKRRFQSGQKDRFLGAVPFPRQLFCCYRSWGSEKGIREYHPEMSWVATRDPVNHPPSF